MTRTPRKRLLLALVLALLGVGSCFGISRERIDVLDRGVGLRFTAYPLVPAMSEVYFMAHPGPWFGWRFLTSLQVNLWYMASSAYFVPDPFFEAGFTLDYRLVERSNFTLSVGAGTALSTELVDGPAGSFPAIVEVKALTAPFARRVLLGSRLQGLLYGDGFILDLYVPLYFGPFGRGFVFEVGGGVNYGSIPSQSITQISPKIGVGLTYTF